MKSFNYMFWGNTDGRNKKLGSTFDNDGSKLIKLALGVVIAVRRIESAPRRKHTYHTDSQPGLTLFSSRFPQPEGSEDPHQKGHSYPSRSL